MTLADNLQAGYPPFLFAASPRPSPHRDLWHVVHIFLLHKGSSVFPGDSLMRRNRNPNLRNPHRSRWSSGYGGLPWVADLLRFTGGLLCRRRAEPRSGHPTCAEKTDHHLLCRLDACIMACPYNISCISSRCRTGRGRSFPIPHVPGFERSWFLTSRDKMQLPLETRQE
jgi:hypothetical protein